MKEDPELAQLGRLFDTGGIEDEPLENTVAVGRAGDLNARVAQDVGHRVGQAPLGSLAEQNPALDDGIAGRVAVELDRLRKADRAGETAQQRRIDECGVTVSHW